MLSRRAVAKLTLMLTMAIPAGANAASDNYSAATQVNSPGSRLNELGSFGGNGLEHNIGFTEGQVLPGGFAEPDLCPGTPFGDSPFGATAWYELHPDVPGVVRVTVRGDESPPANNFDAVLAFYPFNRSNGVPNIAASGCVDNQRETSPEQIVFAVGGGQSYKLQLGGYGLGPSYQDYYEVFFEFFRNTDGDGVFDFDDACPTVPGTLANGCPAPPPPPDADNDGVPENGADKCPGENARERDGDGNGCLNLAQFNPNWDFDPGPYFRRRGGRVKLLGVTVVRLGVTGLPRGARVAVSCNSRRVCRRTSKTANSRGRVYFNGLKGKRLRAGGHVLIRITANGYLGSWRRYLIGKNKLDSGTRQRGCLEPGSPRLRRSGTCSTVR